MRAIFSTTFRQVVILTAFWKRPTIFQNHYLYFHMKQINYHNHDMDNLYGKAL